MPEPRRPERIVNGPPSPLAPGGSHAPRFPEPPALRPTSPSSARVCVNCSSPVSFRTAPPLCWGCGRTLCVDCYWRHGLTPAAHTCAACNARGVTGPQLARSGARATERRTPTSPPLTSP